MIQLFKKSIKQGYDAVFFFWNFLRKLSPFYAPQFYSKKENFSLHQTLLAPTILDSNHSNHHMAF